MAIKTLKLTESGDIEHDTLSRPTWLYGKDAIDQMFKAEISLVKGNWSFDPTRGVDRLGIMKRQFNRGEVISILTTAALKNKYITEVVDIMINVDSQNRVASIAYMVKANKEIITGNVII
jgi:hypothetical protein